MKQNQTMIPNGMPNLSSFNLTNATMGLTRLFGRATQKLNNVCHLATQYGSGKPIQKQSSASKEEHTKNDRLAALASFLVGASSVVGVWYCRNNNAQCDSEPCRQDRPMPKIRVMPWKMKRRKKRLTILTAVSQLGISSIQQPIQGPAIEPPPTLIILKKDPNAIPETPLPPASLRIVSRAASYQLP